MIKGIARTLLICLLALPASKGLAQGLWQPSGMLEIHYINVGQGGSTLIIGPNGTRILYDFGKVKGDRDIVPYLRSTVGLAPQQGLHFTIVSHRDTDHYVGFREVIAAGYDVIVANYDSGSPKTSSKIKERWLDPAETTTAGAVRPIPVGLAIALGDGAQVFVAAANGRVYGDANPVEFDNENDRSVSLYISYGNFQFILDGDLGGGREACSNHDTSQVNVQTRVAQSLLNAGLMSDEHGVDVLHIAHHGSESSTPASYFNLVKPEVGLISVGVRQGTFKHPREDVVDVILLDGPLRATAACNLVAPLVELLQTEDGKVGESRTGRTSFSGKTIGNIKLVTDGRREYTITGDNLVHEGEVESDEPYARTFLLDEVEEEPQANTVPSGLDNQPHPNADRGGRPGELDLDPGVVIHDSKTAIWRTWRPVPGENPNAALIHQSVIVRARDRDYQPQLPQNVDIRTG